MNFNVSDPLVRIGVGLSFELGLGLGWRSGEWTQL